MRGYLLDTSILLWAWHQPERIPARIRQILEADASFQVSMATFWEVAIKVSIGKLTTVADPFVKADETGVKIVGIRPEHVTAAQQLPLHHRDPFDRMLIAQAQVERLTILTADRAFASYDVTLA